MTKAEERRALLQTQKEAQPTQQNTLSKADERRMILQQQATQPVVQPTATPVQTPITTPVATTPKVQPTTTQATQVAPTTTARTEFAQYLKEQGNNDTIINTLLNNMTDKDVENELAKVKKTPVQNAVNSELIAKNNLRPGDVARQVIENTANTVGTATVSGSAKALNASKRGIDWLTSNDSAAINPQRLLDYANGNHGILEDRDMTILYNLAKERQDDLRILYNRLYYNDKTLTADEIKDYLNRSQKHVEQADYMKWVEPSERKFQEQKQANTERYNPGVANTMNFAGDVAEVVAPTLIAGATGVGTPVSMGVGGAVAGENKMNQYLEADKSYEEARKEVPIETAKGVALGTIFAVAKPIMTSGLISNPSTLADAGKNILRLFVNGFGIGSVGALTTQQLDWLKDDPNYDYMNWDNINQGIKEGKYKDLNDYINSNDYIKDVASNRFAQIGIAGVLTGGFNVLTNNTGTMNAIKQTIARGKYDPTDDLKLLGLEKGATQEEINKAYRQWAKINRPDKGNVSSEANTEIKEAVERLRNYKQGTIQKFVNNLKDWFKSQKATVNTQGAMATDQALVPYAGNQLNVQAMQNIPQVASAANVATQVTPQVAQAVQPIQEQVAQPSKITTEQSLENIRDFKGVGNKQIKAYQYENPEVKPFFQHEAKNMLEDLNNAIKGETTATWNDYGELKYTGTSRETTDDIAELLDGDNGVKLSYDDIRKGLNAIINDQGSENIAAAKRIEMILDRRLREGYVDSYGTEYEPNQNYKNFLEGKEWIDPDEYERQLAEKMYASENNLPTKEEFIDDIVKNYNEFTRGDLQGTVEAYAEQANLDDEELLEEIDRRVAEQVKRTLKRMETAQEIKDRTLKRYNDAKQKHFDSKVGENNLYDSGLTKELNKARAENDKDLPNLNKAIKYQGYVAANGENKMKNYTSEALTKDLQRRKEIDDAFKSVYGMTPEEVVKNAKNNKLPTTDNTGRELTKQQQNYYKDTSFKARDNEGHLLRLYHTTPAEFSMFDNSKIGENTGYSNTAFGTFVTPNKAFSTRFGDIDNKGNSFKTMELYTNAKKIITHPFNAYDKYQGEELDNITREYIDAVYGEEGLKPIEETLAEIRESVPEATFYDAYASLIADSDPFETAEEDRKKLEAKGYDGVEFVEGLEKDLVEGSESLEPVVSLALFNGNNLKSAANTNPQNTPDVNDLLPTTDELKQQIDQQHKMSNEKIAEAAKALNLGGNEPPEPPNSGKRASAGSPPPEPPEEKKRSWPKTARRNELVNEFLDVQDMTYVPASNENQIAYAQKQVQNMGYDGAMNYLENKIRLNEKVTADDVALGEHLITEAIKNGEFDKAQDLIADVSILGTELGQAVQALSLINRMTPEGQLKYINKVVDRINNKIDKQNQNKKDTKKKNNIKIDKKLAANVLKAEDPVELQNAVDETLQDLANQMDVTLGDKIAEWRYLSMLGNPRTHIRNMVANVAMRGTYEVKNGIQRAIETIANPKERTRTFEKASEDVKKFAEQSLEENKDVLTGETNKTVEGRIKELRTIFKTAPLEKLRKINSNALSLEDNVFTRNAFKSNLAEYLTANKIKTQADIDNNPEIVQKGIQYAMEEAWKTTFHQISKAATEINRLENINGVSKLFIGGTIPFKKTPINIAKTGASYSPLGLLETLTAETYKLKNGDITANQYIDRLSQGLTGAGLFGIGLLLSSLGILKGSNDSEKDDTYRENIGQTKGYSIRLGDRNYDLSWLSPAAMPLLMGAELVNASQGEKTKLGDIAEALGSTLNPLSEMSLLSGINSTLKAYSNSDSPYDAISSISENALKSYFGQFIPTIFGQVNKVIDPTQRVTTPNKDSEFKSLESFGRQQLNKIPGASYLLEPKTDVWGKEVKRNDNALVRAFDAFINPGTVTEDKTTKVDEEILSLLSEVGDKDIIPKIPSNYYQSQNYKYEMSAKDYTTFKKNYGQESYKGIEKLMDSEEYKDATPEDKAKMIKKVYEDARTNARAKYEENKYAKDGEDYKEKLNDELDNSKAFNTFYHIGEEGRKAIKEQVEKDAILDGKNDNNVTAKDVGAFMDIRNKLEEADIPLVDYYMTWYAQKGQKNKKGRTTAISNMANDLGETKDQKNVLYEIFNVN